MQLKNIEKSQILSKNLSILPNTDKTSKSAKSNKSSVNFKEDIQNNESSQQNEELKIPPYVGKQLQQFTVLNENLDIEPTFEYEDDAFVKNTDLRYNPWSKTILGNCQFKLKIHF